MLYFIVFFIIGTVVGSFLNVCIHRLPRGESVIFPPSRCPQCQHKLGALDLIPVLGFFILGGKCRYCKAPISFRYPLVELSTGLLFVGVAAIFPLAEHPLEFFFYLAFSLLLIIIIFTDLEHEVIPDSLNVVGIVLGLVFNLLAGLFFRGQSTIFPFLSALLGMFLGYFIFLIIARGGRWLFKKEAMGEGDLYLAAFLGAWLGWQGVLLAILLAFLSAGVVLVILLALGRVKMGQVVPFGPALAVAGMLALFFGKQILSWYYNWFW
jgi:leader peptidase (prepilin peptidase)/N-methyltransferase